MDKIKITFLGAAQVVTGSCYLVECSNVKFLVDCGMFQGNKALKERNYGDFPFNPGEIDFVVLTHAHIDHSGLIPKLYKKGFAGPTYGTSGTIDLCKVMLPDSGHIQEMEVERKNRKNARSGKPLLTPIYSVEEAERCIRYFKKVKYDTVFEPVTGIKIKMRDGGHILGSAILEIWLAEDEKETKIVFTGDLGRTDRPIIKDPTIIEEADYLIIESTYGNRFHEEAQDNDATLVDAINDTFRRGGNVVIPAFAVERTQDLLLTLNTLIEEGKIAPKAVYVDSPLAVAATEVFINHPQYFDKETKAFMKEHGRSPFILPNLTYVRKTEESIELNSIKSGAIIISASGMADAGRIKHHLKHNLWRQESTVIFVGYQAQGTLGRRLVDGEPKVRIHGEEIVVNAKIIMLEGYSAHADQKELLTWLGNFSKLPKKIFVTHGEAESSSIFAQKINEKYHVDTIVPAIGDSYYLDDEKLKSTTLYRQTDISNALYNEILANLNSLVKEQSEVKLKKIKDFIDKIM